MKQQISRLSPHQNGKVFGVITALISLVFLVPFFLLFGLAAPKGAGLPFLMMLIAPVIYLVVTYVGVVVGCWIYNKLFPHIGGIEFEASTDGAL